MEKVGDEKDAKREETWSKMVSVKKRLQNLIFHFKFQFRIAYSEQGIIAASIVMRVVFFVALLAGSAQGWGRDGHAIIADIASGLVKDTTRTQVLKLLGADGNMSGTSYIL